MATYSLVHGAWHGGWAWDLVRAELESRGHVVNTPDLPIEDVDATVADYARVVPPADVVVGHSLGGVVIPLVEARVHVHVCALLGGMSWRDAFVPGFGDARIRDELGRSYYPDPADAARELQYVCTRDTVIRPDWQRAVAHEPLELEAGHSPMLECPVELAALLERIA